MKRDLLDSVADYLEIVITSRQRSLLGDYSQWLIDEAIPAGGLGPDEYERLESRHIADSLLFAAGFSLETEWVRDIGSGVGLPGIPLAILLPETEFQLVERSGRRIDLMNRATRVLGLDNVEVVQKQIERITAPSPVLVSRAVMSPADLALRANRLLTVGGTAVLGGSWVKRPQAPGWETIEIPAMVLDQPIWLLIMRRQ